MAFIKEFNVGDKISLNMLTPSCDGEVISVLEYEDPQTLLKEYFNLTEKEDFQLLHNTNNGRIAKLAFNKKMILDVGLIVNDEKELNYSIEYASLLKVDIAGFFGDTILVYLKGKSNSLDNLFLPVNVRYGLAFFNSMK